MLLASFPHNAKPFIYDSLNGLASRKDMTRMSTYVAMYKSKAAYGTRDTSIIFGI